MVDLLFDSNILIDSLNRHQPAREVLNEVEVITISRVTWIEVMAGAKAGWEVGTEAFLRGCRIIELDLDIARRAAVVRRSSRIKLPDAVIWATALVTERTLVTRNTKDFAADMPGIRVPYQR